MRAPWCGGSAANTNLTPFESRNSCRLFPPRFGLVCLEREQRARAVCNTRLLLLVPFHFCSIPLAGLWAMWRRSDYLFMVVSVFLTVCRRSMASRPAAAGTRYAVQLLPPQQGSVLGVGNSDDKASAVSSYKVLQEPVGSPFDGLQVRRACHITTAVLGSCMVW